jgi:hypothetical protein
MQMANLMAEISLVYTLSVTLFYGIMWMWYANI